MVGATAAEKAASGTVDDSRAAIWSAVDRLIDRTPDVAALRANRLHLLAARRWREQGKTIPEDLEEDERLNVLAWLVAPEVVAAVRRGCDGPVVLHKGPNVAALYPDPTLRPFIDLDVLVVDAAAAQSSLLEAGFVEVGDPRAYVVSPHSRPLEWPGLPLRVEVHDHPNWPRWLPPPPTDELIDQAIPSVLGVEGVSTLAPQHQALVVAAHAWTHGPFSRVGDLVDVAALDDGLDSSELQRLARRWGIEGLWRTTLSTAHAVLFDGPQPWTARTWARNLPAVRERTMFEFHMARWLSGFSTLGPRGGFRVLGGEIARDVRPIGDEPWRAKLSRAWLSLRNARVTKSEHDQAVERTARRR